MVVRKSGHSSPMTGFRRDSHRAGLNSKCAERTTGAERTSSQIGTRVRFHPTSGAVRLCSPEIDAQAAGDYAQTAKSAPMHAQCDEQCSYNNPLPVVSHELDCLFHMISFLLVSRSEAGLHPLRHTLPFLESSLLYTSQARIELAAFSLVEDPQLPTLSGTVRPYLISRVELRVLKAQFARTQFGLYHFHLDFLLVRRTSPT